MRDFTSTSSESKNTLVQVIFYKYCHLQATVELQGTHTRGMLVVDKRYWFAIENKNVDIVESVDIERVKSLMKRAFGHN